MDWSTSRGTNDKYCSLVCLRQFLNVHMVADFYVNVKDIKCLYYALVIHQFNINPQYV